MPFFDVFEVTIYLFLIVVILLRVLCAQFGAISCQQNAAYQIKVSGYFQCFSENLFDGFRIVFFEVIEGIVIGVQALGQPDRFYVPFGLLFQSS